MELTDLAFAARLIAIPLALTLDPFAPLLVLGVGLRMGWIQDPLLTRPEFAGFADPIFIAIVGALYLIHALADKLPPFGHLFDAIGLFAKPLAGVVIGLWMTNMLDHGSTLHWVAIAVVMFGGLPAALGLQAARTKVRLAASAGSAGLLHPVASTIESAFALPVAYLAVAYPGLALLVIAVVVVPGMWIALYFFRAMIRQARRATTRAKALYKDGPPNPMHDHVNLFP